MDSEKRECLHVVPIDGDRKNFLLGLDKWVSTDDNTSIDREVRFDSLVCFDLTVLFDSRVFADR